MPIPTGASSFLACVPAWLEIERAHDVAMGLQLAADEAMPRIDVPVTPRFRGRVLRTDTGEPAAGAVVHRFDQVYRGRRFVWRIRESVVADASGQFQFTPARLGPSAPGKRLVAE